MAHLDNIGWEAGLAFTSYGARLGLRYNAPDLLPQFYPQLPPSWEPLSTPRVDGLYSVVIAGRSGAEHADVHRLFLGPKELLRTPDLAVLVDRLSSDIHHQIALRARDGLFVHAGVVGWRGAAIVLPGRSHSGKSTLVRELVRAGAEYCSDEYAIFDADGLVLPYPKRLSLRSDRHRVRQFRSAEELGGTTATRPLWVGLIAAIQYAPDAEWRPQPLSQGQTVLALLDNTVLARSRPDVALERFGRAVARAVGVSGMRGESHAMALALLQYFDACGPPTDTPPTCAMPPGDSISEPIV